MRARSIVSVEKPGDRTRSRRDRDARARDARSTARDASSDVFLRTIFVPSDSVREHGVRARRRVPLPRAVATWPCRQVSRKGGDGFATRAIVKYYVGISGKKPKKMDLVLGGRPRICRGRPREILSYTLFRRGDVKRPRSGIATIGFSVGGERRRRRAGPTSVMERAVAEIGRAHV